MEPGWTLVAYEGMLVLYSFFFFWILNRDDFPFEPLIVSLSALTTLVVLLRHHVQVIDFWLSLLLVVFAVALFAFIPAACSISSRPRCSSLLLSSSNSARVRTGGRAWRVSLEA